MIREKTKKTRTRNALLHASPLLLAADRCLGKGVQDGVHACCVAWRASRTCVGKGVCDEQNAAIQCRGLFRVGFDERGEVGGFGIRMQ